MLCLTLSATWNQPVRLRSSRHLLAGVAEIEGDVGVGGVGAGRPKRGDEGIGYGVERGVAGLTFLGSPFPFTVFRAASCTETTSAVIYRSPQKHRRREARADRQGGQFRFHSGHRSLSGAGSRFGWRW